MKAPKIVCTTTKKKQNEIEREVEKEENRENFEEKQIPLFIKIHP